MMYPFFFLLLEYLHRCESFYVVTAVHQSRHIVSTEHPKPPRRKPVAGLIMAATRYGPPPLSSPEGQGRSTYNNTGDNRSQDKDSSIKKQKHDNFRALIEQVMSITRPEHLPRLLANNLDVITALQGEEGSQIICNILEEARQQDETAPAAGIDDHNDPKLPLYTRTLQVVETILSFAEDFVEQAQEMDNRNKKLLGRIIMAMTRPDDFKTNKSQMEGNRSNERTPLSKEEVLDQFMEEEKSCFTPGFLRHIEGECERISGSRKVTPESARLLEIMRVIQARVLEEVGKEMGEATLVLGQIIAYDNEEELLGVLDAGLKVRGREFAIEMRSLTQEALDGFQKVPGGVDNELVDRVTFIDERLHEFLNETNMFQ
jgi:hypothetical protein